MQRYDATAVLLDNITVLTYIKPVMFSSDFVNKGWIKRRFITANFQDNHHGFFAGDNLSSTRKE